MKFKYKAQYSLIICLLSTLMTGCVQPNVDISEVLNHNRCQKLRKGIKQVPLKDLARIRGVDFLGSTRPDDFQTVTAQEEVIASPLLFAISNGSQPTPGYAFKLRQVQANKQDIEIHYSWITPAPDAVMAQVTTHPCSVIQITTDSTQTRSEVASVSAWLDGTLLGRTDIAYPAR